MENKKIMLFIVFLFITIYNTNVYALKFMSLEESFRKEYWYLFYVFYIILLYFLFKLYNSFKNYKKNIWIKKKSLFQIYIYILWIIILLILNMFTDPLIRIFYTDKYNKNINKGISEYYETIEQIKKVKSNSNQN